MNHKITGLVVFSALWLAAGASLIAASTSELTVTINGRGTLSPNYNGKTLNVGQTYKMKAIAGTGCEFSDWVVAGPTNTTTNADATLTFQMASNLELTVTFLDIQPPTVDITTKGGSASNAVFTVSGTAKDNVGVTAVWYQVGTGGWNLAATSDDYTNWMATVLLSAGENTILVYAEDAAGNKSKTNSLSVDDNASGFAPASLAGTILSLVSSNNESATLSFNGVSFSQMGSPRVSSGVGYYSYALSNADTAVLTRFMTEPSMDGTNGEVFDFTFTNATSGTWINSDGSSGTFTLAAASSTAPVSLSGLTLRGANSDSNFYQFTNSYGDGTFTSSNTSGNSSGIYTYSLYSPEAGLVEQIANDGSTNFILVDFAAGADAYYAASANDTNGGGDLGTFSVSGELNTAGYTAPVSLNGLTGAVTQVDTDGSRKSFVVSFDASTFGQFTAGTNGDSGVGTYTYTRTGPKTAVFMNTYTAPPSEVANGGSGAVSFVFTSSHSATFANSDGHGTVTLSSPASTAPVSLVGRTLTGHSPDGSGSISFGLGTFANSGSEGSGTYTYAAVGPQAALVVRSYTSGENAGETDYITLFFSSATGGNFSDSKSDGSVTTGTFTMK